TQQRQVLGVVAGGRVNLLEQPQLWSLLVALPRYSGVVATRMEGASGREHDQRRRLPHDAVEAIAPATVDPRQRCQQAPRVRMPRVVEGVVDGAKLDLTAG